MVCPHRHATSKLSLVHATWIVPSRNVMDCTLDKCRILSLEFHGLSQKQVSWIDTNSLISKLGHDERYHLINFR